MTLPGPVIRESESAIPRTAPTDLSTLFLVGTAERLPLEPTPVRSVADLLRLDGGVRTAVNAALVDAVRCQELLRGGQSVIVSRAAAAAAVRASVVAAIGGANVTATAASPGTWGNGLSFNVAGNVVTVSESGVGAVETFDLSSASGAAQAALLAELSAKSRYVRFTVGGTSPQALPATLSGGTVGTVASADTLAAADRLPASLGPGQLYAPLVTDTATHLGLMARAKDRNRVALLDVPNTAVKADVKTHLAALKGQPGSDRGGPFWPNVRIPGQVPGTMVVVGWGAVQAAMLARNDRAGIGPTQPAAGDLGIADAVIELTLPAWSDADREELNDAGLNVPVVLGYDPAPRQYGNRTVADPVATPLAVTFGGARLAMAVKARMVGPLDAVVQKVIPRDRGPLKACEAQIAAALKQLGSSLWGYSVDVVSDEVNPPDQLAQRKVRGRVRYQESPTAEVVELDVIRTPITQEL